MPLTGIEYRRVASRGALLAFVRAHRERSAAQPATLARLPLSPTPPHLPKRNSSTASPTASLHCWHSAMRRSPSWAGSSTQCCRSSALARAATSSSICPRISGAATRRDRHHHRFAQEFLAARGGVSDEVARKGAPFDELGEAERDLLAATRSDALPDVPTVSEFLPGYEAKRLVRLWFSRKHATRSHRQAQQG